MTSPSIHWMEEAKSLTLLRSLLALTSAVTWHPSRIRSLTRWDPMNPVAPVTKTFTLLVFDGPIVRYVVIERIEPHRAGGIVGMARAVGHHGDRLAHPFESVPDLGRYDDERIIIGTEKNFHQISGGGGAFAIVVKHQ